ncbi:uncharacterized protein TERG_08171 [Trichophyton rubrum CBS 118892]|uniref:Uncharacterized protein n=1 Tax=Trichophyton rubrum (strain ATCC MYA-4607 / CBS 118892) TaxID=559305 RepID=F2T033_TRIRC|nr:uncharacterized protein TERG_08171 [Trichophyton rubrum CBS 118892]EGD91955.2 hypothetical protein TERG_08171 [Trichophyton rubrum CBS 118892]
MHNILSLAAMHLASLQPHLLHKYTLLAARHQSHVITAARARVASQQVTSQNCSAVVICSALLLLYELAILHPSYFVSEPVSTSTSTTTSTSISISTSAARRVDEIVQKMLPGPGSLLARHGNARPCLSASRGGTILSGPGAVGLYHAACTIGCIRCGNRLAMALLQVLRPVDAAGLATGSGLAEHGSAAVHVGAAGEEASCSSPAGSLLCSAGAASGQLVDARVAAAGAFCSDRSCR